MSVSNFAGFVGPFIFTGLGVPGAPVMSVGGSSTVFLTTYSSVVTGSVPDSFTPAVASDSPGYGLPCGTFAMSTFFALCVVVFPRLARSLVLLVSS